MIEQMVNVSEAPGWLIKPKSRRVREFSILDEMLLRLFQPGLTYRVEANPIPEDGRIVGVRYDIVAGCWRIYIHSETFDEVPEAALPPPMPPPILCVTVIDSAAESAAT